MVGKNNAVTFRFCKAPPSPKSKAAVELMLFKGRGQVFLVDMKARPEALPADVGRRDNVRKAYVIFQCRIRLNHLSGRLRNP